MDIEGEPGPQGRPDRSGQILVFVFVLVISSFLASSLLAQYASSEIGRMAERLSTNTGPSIELLATIRSSAMAAERALSRQMTGEKYRTDPAARFDSSLARLGESLRAYLSLPLSPGERVVHDEVQQAWARFEESAHHTRELLDRGELAGARQSVWRVDRALERLVDATMKAIEFNARHGQDLAARIARTRRRAELVANILTVICVALGIAGAILLYAQARHRNALTDARAHDLAERAAELEQFAGRVAHDIRNPLSAAVLATEVIKQQSGESTARLADRLLRNLMRADAITTALLEFARSGARPDPGARVSPADVLADLGPQLEIEAEAHDIELTVGPIPPTLVACSEGVYLSLLGNLVRNAIRYMGGSEERRIAVSVTESGSTVRTEVLDTGPGLPQESLPSLFEPYFRGANAHDSEGLGLGLPTVRRLALRHDGAAGVSSKPGEGSVFWFELPRAGTVEVSL